MKISKLKLLTSFVTLCLGMAWGSEFDELVELPAGTKLINVHGSAGDRYNNKFNTVCNAWLSFGFYHATNPGLDIRKSDNCDPYSNRQPSLAKTTICAFSQKAGDVVGGHMHILKGDQTLDPNNVYILPISRSNNGKDYFIGTLPKGYTAIKLKNYGYWNKKDGSKDSINPQLIYQHPALKK